MTELEKLKAAELDAFADFAECCALVLDSAEALRALANEIHGAGRAESAALPWASGVSSKV